MKTHCDTLGKLNANAISTLLVCIFIAVSIITIYFQATRHEFTNYDDDVYVSENRLIQKGLTLENVLRAFSEETAGNWHPLTTLSHMLDYHLYGLKPGLHLLTNILLHALNAIFLFLLMKSMTGFLWRSALVAALFATHPIHVESVAWISERKDILSMLFWLLTVWSYSRYARYRNIKTYFWVFIFLLLGLMTKPMLVTLPFVLLLFDVWPLNRYKTSNMSIAGLIYEKIPLFVPVIVSCFITLEYQKAGNAVKSLISYPLHIRLENAFVSYVTYIKKIFWPFNFSVFYPHSIEPPLWQAAASLSILILITFYSLYYLKKKPWLFFGWFLYTGMLIPVIGLVQVGSQALADRYTYIPSVGIFIITVWTGTEFISKYRWNKTVVSILLSLMICIIILLSNLQTSYWKNGITLFRHAIDVTEQNYLAHNNLGHALKQVGNNLEAIKHYKKSLSIHPDYVLAHNNIGVALMDAGQTEEALKHFTFALKLMPEFIPSHINLASSFFDKGYFQKAADQCKKALQIKQDSIELMLILGNSSAATGKKDEAEIHYKKALQLNPDSAIAHSHFGAFLFKNNKLNQALFHFKTALDLQPNEKIYKTNFNNALQVKEKIYEDIKEKLIHLEKNPLNSAAHTELGHLYKKAGNKESALNHYQKALDGDSEFIPALKAIAFDYAENEEYEKAVFFLKKVLMIDTNIPDTYYNIACMYAKQNKIKVSAAWLKKALANGYSNWELIKTDRDLDNIRNSPEYLSILNQQAH